MSTNSFYPLLSLYCMTTYLTSAFILYMMKSSYFLEHEFYETNYFS